MKAEANNKHNAALIAAKNPKCSLQTLQKLAEHGLPIDQKCETQASVLFYYVRYNEKVDKKAVQWLIEQGCEITHADKNKMTVLHYAMINNNVGVEEIRLLHESGADINFKMAQDIDLLDLVIYT